MAIEIEKKFRLASEQRLVLDSLLPMVGATLRGKAFEENIIFAGRGLDQLNRILRLRRTNGKAILTYKERMDSDKTVRRRREVETDVAPPENMIEFLSKIGVVPMLIYEKHRTTWDLANTEVTIDELPFGLFVEIEGDEDAIRNAESLLDPVGLKVELLTYHELVRKHGTKNGEVIEARFKA
ncbi:MAG TPA: class IV adenylate cyclase [Pyrinomonadaceae bacterium]|nr:class IV adenylate cyclase [Pyrinomonadaceae bacterium]